MSDQTREQGHRCRPETGAIEGIVFYSAKSGSWVMTVVPPGPPPRQQRVDVRFCPWCGKDLQTVTLDADVTLLE